MSWVFCLSEKEELIITFRVKDYALLSDPLCALERSSFLKVSFFRTFFTMKQTSHRSCIYSLPPVLCHLFAHRSLHNICDYGWCCSGSNPFPCIRPLCSAVWDDGWGAAFSLRYLSVLHPPVKATSVTPEHARLCPFSLPTFLKIRLFFKRECITSWSFRHQLSKTKSPLRNKIVCLTSKTPTTILWLTNGA